MAAAAAPAAEAAAAAAGVTLRSGRSLKSENICTVRGPAGCSCSAARRRCSGWSPSLTRRTDPTPPAAMQPKRPAEKVLGRRAQGIHAEKDCALAAWRDSDDASWCRNTHLAVRMQPLTRYTRRAVPPDTRVAASCCQCHCSVSAVVANEK